MVRKLALKAVSYMKAPRTTFALLHPRKALKYGLMFWLGKLLFGGREEDTRHKTVGH